MLIPKKTSWNRIVLYAWAFFVVTSFLAFRVANREKLNSYEYFIVFEKKRISIKSKDTAIIGLDYYIITDTSMSLELLVKKLAEGRPVDKSNLFSIVDDGDIKSLSDCMFPYVIDYNTKLCSVLYEIFYIGHGNPLFKGHSYLYEQNDTEILIGKVQSKHPVVPMEKKFLECIKTNRLFLSNVEDNNFYKINDTLSLRYSISNFNPSLNSVFLSPNAFFNDIDTVFYIH